MSRLLISFSGGETSAYMTNRLLTDSAARSRYSNIKIVFANTGEENEQTLEFVDRCDKHFSWGVVWVEAVVYFGERKSAGARVVDFKSASRSGEPFESVIAKYGIPNSKFPGCTRDLKLNPLRNYLRTQGWEPGTYDTAIGIRADEFDRVPADSAKRRLIHPLVRPWPTTKPQINKWWSAQPFRLRLKGYQGNCKWCWKKSFRKHLTLLDEMPNVYDFPERMERLYGHVGPEFGRYETAPGYRRTFFRGNRSVADLRQMLAQAKAKGTYEPAKDDSMVDEREGGCGESCEVFSEETSQYDAVRTAGGIELAIYQAEKERAYLTEMIEDALVWNR